MFQKKKLKRKLSKWKNCYNTISLWHFDAHVCRSGLQRQPTDMSKIHSRHFFCTFCVLFWVPHFSFCLFCHSYSPFCSNADSIFADVMHTYICRLPCRRVWRHFVATRRHAAMPVTRNVHLKKSDSGDKTAIYIIVERTKCRN